MMNASDPITFSSLHTRPSLLGRVRSWEDHASWTEFYRLYRKLIYGYARRSGLAHADAEDLTQDVFKCVAETIDRFESDPQRGSFRSWLVNLTRWRLTDRFRRLAPDQRTSGDFCPPGSVPAFNLERLPDGADQDTHWEQEWQSYLLEAGCERLARRTKPRQYQAFHLYVRQRQPVWQVASELGMSAASVYLAGHRLTRELKAEVQKLRQQLG